MTIDPELLMAYADGELDPLAAKRVERAIAADPALAAQVDAHRALAASLRAAFDPLAVAPPPAALVRTIEEAARVVPIARPAPAAARRTERRLWAGAIAASLIAGLIAGPLVLPRQGGSDIAFVADGSPQARGALARALDTQLASTQAADAPVRIGVSFRDGAGRLCRSFDRAGAGGIACAQGGDWRVERLYGGMTRDPAAYRQAGSASAAMMRDAQEMMVGEPLDAAAEAAALRAR